MRPIECSCSTPGNSNRGTPVHNPAQSLYPTYHRSNHHTQTDFYSNAASYSGSPPYLHAIADLYPIPDVRAFTHSYTVSDPNSTNRVSSIYSPSILGQHSDSDSQHGYHDDASSHRHSGTNGTPSSRAYRNHHTSVYGYAAGLPNADASLHDTVSHVNTCSHSFTYANTLSNPHARSITNSNAHPYSHSAPCSYSRSHVNTHTDPATTLTTTAASGGNNRDQMHLFRRRDSANRI